MNDPFLAINATPDELIAAGRRLAWASGMDIDAMDGLLRKVMRWSDAQRLRVMVRAGVNDD